MYTPMSGPDLTEEELSAVTEVVETRYLSIGPKLDDFEERFAGAAHAASVNSGTSGLHLCMIAAGIEPRDLVITTPFSFVASANCILYEGGIPIFVDVDPVTSNIDPDLVADAVSDLARGGDAANRWLPPAVRNRKSEIDPARSRLRSTRRYGSAARRRRGARSNRH